MSLSINTNNYEPRRFGLRYQPPQIVLEYWCLTRKKLYHHIIKLHKLKKDSNVKEVVNQIYIDHKNYLVNKVQETQITNLVELLINNIKSTNKDNKENREKKENKYNNENKDNQDNNHNKVLIDKNLNLNELENEEIDKYKGEMDKIFKQHSIKEDDPDYVYDKREEFVGKINDPDWDIDIDEVLNL